MYCVLEYLNSSINCSRLVIFYSLSGLMIALLCFDDR
uniref:Uncharacterized protein n=1 Tax=Arundo donax TaxID=35708 RepID=A0A0A9C4A2_ARUDO